jgi:hypothetical protein
VLNRTRVVHLLALSCLLTTGCLATPQPIVISQTPGQVIEIRYDAGGGGGHAHPAAVSLTQITAILKGVYIRGRDVIGTANILWGGDSEPAFTERDISQIAPHLIAGLAKASPVDLVTFHLSQRDTNRALLITSGGVFVRNGHLYLILANARTSLSAVQYENVSEPNTTTNPLLPIARYKFSVGMLPAEWKVENSAAKRLDGWNGYLDESKVVVVDLARVPLSQKQIP